MGGGEERQYCRLSPSLPLSLSLYLLLLRGTWCVCGVGVGDESVFFLSRGVVGVCPRVLLGCGCRSGCGLLGVGYWVWVWVWVNRVNCVNLVRVID